MKVAVDTEKCMGHGQCYARAPEIYQPDDEGFCLVVAADPEPALASQAVDGAEACPEHAITISDA